MAESLAFGPFVLDQQLQALLRDGAALPIGQRALALLTALARVEGPVDKSVLIEAAWPGTFVEENNLTVQIASLRKAMGQREDGTEWIITVPRVGYRLIRSGIPSKGEIESGGPRLPSIIVLPF